MAGESAAGSAAQRRRRQPPNAPAMNSAPVPNAPALMNVRRETGMALPRILVDLARATCNATICATSRPPACLAAGSAANAPPWFDRLPNYVGPAVRQEPRELRLPSWRRHGRPPIRQKPHGCSNTGIDSLRCRRLLLRRALLRNAFAGVNVRGTLACFVHRRAPTCTDVHRRAPTCTDVHRLAPTCVPRRPSAHL